MPATRAHDHSRPRVHLPRLVALLSALALALTACGGDGGTSDDTADEPTAADADTGGAATDDAAEEGDGGTSDGAADAAAAPDGEPIRLGSVLTIQNPAWSNAGTAAVNEAWAAWVNEELGGINGRPLEVINCDDEGDPALALSCTEDLIDEGVVAFVNNSSLAFGPNALPTMESEGLVNLGGWPIFDPEYQSEHNFPSTPGASGSYPALAVYLRQELGAESVALVHTEGVAGESAAEDTAQVWESLGGTEAVLIAFDPTATDFTPAMTEVRSSGVDAAILLVGEGPAARMFQAAQIAGLDIPLTATSTAATQAVFDAAGDAAEGIIYAFAVVPPDSDSEDVARYREIMETHAPDVELTNQTGVAANSMDFAVAVLTALGDAEITPDAIRELVESGEVTGGFMTHSMSPEFAPEALPRVWNPYNLVAEYVGDGRFEPLAEDLEEGPHVSHENGIAWLTGFAPAG